MKHKLHIDLIKPGPLSPAEARVLSEWLTGDPHKVCASRLFISVKTLETHIDRIKHKLDARNQLVAMKAAEDQGLIKSRLIKFLCIVLCCGSLAEQSAMRPRLSRARATHAVSVASAARHYWV